MSRLPHRRLLLPALTAAVALSPAALATPARAAGAQPIDATVEYQCAEQLDDIAASQQRAILQLKASVSATTSHGERVRLTDASATLRLLAPGTPSTTTLVGSFDRLLVDATGVDDFGPNTFSGFMLNPGKGSVASTPYTDGGFGPATLPIQDEYDPTPRRTSGAAPVVLTPGLLAFKYQLLPAPSAPGEPQVIPLPSQQRYCRPVPGQASIATIPNLADAPPPPSVTSVSPTSGPVRGGNTVTLKGAGFSTPGTPIVTFDSNPFQGLDVRVIDDQTLTFKMPFSYGEGPTRIEVELADRTTASWPSPGVEYEFVGGFPQPMVTAVSPSSGRPGDVLTLTGNDVDFITSVQFGAWPASPVDTVVVSESEIKVTVPAGTGTVSMMLSGPVSGGSFASGLGSFTYLAPLPPLPTITRVAPTSVRAGFPALGFITGTRLTSVRAIQVGTKRVPPLLVASSSTALFVAPALPAGTYPVRLVTKDGRLTPSDPTRTITYR